MLRHGFDVRIPSSIACCQIAWCVAISRVTVPSATGGSETVRFSPLFLTYVFERSCVRRAFFGVYVRRYVNSHCLTVVLFFHPYFADRMSFSISTARRLAASRLSLENPVEIR